MINNSMTAMTHKPQMFTDHYAAEYSAYGTEIGGYSECSNEYTVLASDHVTQPNMIFVCFDVRNVATLILLYYGNHGLKSSRR